MRPINGLRLGLCGLAGAALITACAYYPRNKQKLTSRDGNVEFLTLVPGAGRTVNFFAWNNPSNRWDKFDSALTTTSSVTDAKGLAWNYFDVWRRLPQDSKYWLWPGGTRDLEIRVKLMLDDSTDVVSFDTTGADACIDANRGTLGGSDLANKCKSGSSPNITMVLPAGKRGARCLIEYAASNVGTYGTPQYGSTGGCEKGLVCNPQGYCETNTWPWPAQSDYVSQWDEPKDVSQPWWNDIDGIATDGLNWYITNRHHLYKVPLGKKLGTWGGPSDGNYGVVGTDAWHFGDVDTANINGKVYVIVPVEREAGFTEQYPYFFALYDTNLKLLATVEIPVGTHSNPDRHMAWLAYNQEDGYIYTDDQFSIVNYIRRFQPSITVGADGKTTFKIFDQGDIRITDANGVPKALGELQGGAFSNHAEQTQFNDGRLYGNHLYLSSSNNGDTNRDGIYGVDVTGKVQRFIYVPHNPSATKNEELEGLVVFDLIRFGPAAPNLEGSGQIHLLFLQNSIPSDNFFFKHFSLTEGGKPNL